MRRSLAAAIALLLVAAIPARATAAPTVTVVDTIHPGADSSFALDWSNAVVLGEWLYFNADDGVHGHELWRTNGETTEMVLDLNLGAGSGDPQGIYVVGDRLYFSANDGSYGVELWSTDGTPGGTAVVVDINVGAGDSTPYPVGLLGDEFYFGANDGTTGIELWSIDTSTLVVTLHEIAAGASHSQPLSGINYLNYLYFVANDASGNRELWRTDGTAPEVVFPSSGGIAYPTDLVVHNGFLFLTEHLGEPSSFPGRTMYKTPGTLSAATALGVWDMDPDPRETISFGDRLFFSASDGTYGRELWSSSGNGDHLLVADIRGGSGDSSPQDLTALGSWIYFTADDGVHGRELYRSNGTTTSLVSDIWTAGSSYPEHLTPLGHWLYFDAYEPTHDRVLYRSNGSVTERVPLPTSDLTFSCDCYDTAIVTVGERLFFTVHGDAVGQEFAYLDEPTYGLPLTDRDNAPESQLMVVLAALTAAAGLHLRRRGLPRP